ncbi:DUF2071 domain-containing protein [Nonomuraea sp. MCN248]|uniref:DUF2071 domain-containing protein n=1 Tax=Nonomuraea corallina TaxID=2989783 RepID=A0ABT4SC71_9ACTN|nr:DUF2071 domain-containing protein [Nonomuraea corallina]MDA0634807.1 DUF2071 domain-containing protein [Nonomuraea corallina]
MRAPPSPRVARPVMYQRWSNMTFLHWRYPAETVQALVPPQFTVETFDGTAWVGMTPFLMEDVRAPGLPRLPWVSRFPETNLRTYVRDGRGRSGIWFFSLDAGRLPAMLGGRAGYWLPYHWSDMSVRIDAGHWRYRSRRIWPGPRGARCHAESKVGLVLTERERDGLAHFLTARFRLFSQVAGRTVTAEVEHPPWPLHRADLLELDQTLLDSAGLPDAGHDPLVHASPGVPSRIGMWRPI